MSCNQCNVAPVTDFLLSGVMISPENISDRSGSRTIDFSAAGCCQTHVEGFKPASVELRLRGMALTGSRGLSLWPDRLEETFHVQLAGLAGC
jgi:hypothetical protein